MGLQEQKQHFSVNLLDWYMINRRDLPWRRHNNPYFTWVSEIMLQQTRVDTVIPYFNRFIGNFPTVQALAEAPEEDVLKNWEGLGYYSRARNLQAAARQVMELHGGEMPQDKPAVFALKGVGPYTAGAILSIAFNQPQPAVDGNVMRVLSRYFLIDEDIMKGSTRVLMEELAGELIPEGRARDFNQALMELGALVCTPKAPHCLTCPVMEQCSGRIAGRELTLPVKTKAKPPRPEQRLVAIVEGRGAHRGQVLCASAQTRAYWPACGSCRMCSRRPPQPARRRRRWRMSRPWHCWPAVCGRKASLPARKGWLPMRSMCSATLSGACRCTSVRSRTRAVSFR